MSTTPYLDQLRAERPLLYEFVERASARRKPYGCQYCGQPYKKTEYETCFHCGACLPKILFTLLGEPITDKEIDRCGAKWFMALFEQCEMGHYIGSLLRPE